MNPDTGKLVGMNPSNVRIDELFEPVPPSLEHAARRVLKGKPEAQASLTSGGKLPRWAASIRKARKDKAKLAAKSKQRNRK